MLATEAETATLKPAGQEELSGDVRVRACAGASSASDSDAAAEPAGPSETSAPGAAREDWMTKAMPRSAPAAPGSALEPPTEDTKPSVSVRSQSPCAMSCSHWTVFGWHSLVAQERMQGCASGVGRGCQEPCGDAGDTLPVPRTQQPACVLRRQARIQLGLHSATGARLLCTHSMHWVSAPGVQVYSYGRSTRNSRGHSASAATHCAWGLRV